MKKSIIDVLRKEKSWNDVNCLTKTTKREKTEKKEPEQQIQNGNEYKTLIQVYVITLNVNDLEFIS